MRPFAGRILSALATIVVSSQANGQPPTIVLPQAYESIIASAGALATSGASALKTYRSDARILAIRSALTKKILSLGAGLTINLDDGSIEEAALLCKVRQDYINNVVALNYLNTLVQNLNAVSKPVSPPTDLGGALKLLLATSSYSISAGVQSQPVSTLESQTMSACEADLKSYDKDYYGNDTGGAQLTDVERVAAIPDALAFLGPIGSLSDTFVSILQPIIIDASTMVDADRRRKVIEGALNDPATYSRIKATGKQVAIAVDNFASASRRNLAGSFVEQLVSIRRTSIDLSKEAECHDIVGTPRLVSGAPSSAFISCWRAAWAKVQPQVMSLKAVGDNYDKLADAGNVDPQKLLGTILADYDLIKSGRADASNVFWNDVTQFITFANAISSAASKNNISTLTTEFGAISNLATSVLNGATIPTTGGVTTSTGQTGGVTTSTGALSNGVVELILGKVALRFDASVDVTALSRILDMLEKRP